MFLLVSLPIFINTIIIGKKKKIMKQTTLSSSNGNVNSSRETVNNNISKFGMLGNSRRISWNARRSFRSI